MQEESRVGHGIVAFGSGVIAVSTLLLALSFGLTPMGVFTGVIGLVAASAWYAGLVPVAVLSFALGSLSWLISVLTS